MATEVDAIPRENMPLSQPTTYATTNLESDPLTSTGRAIQIPVSDRNVSSDNATSSSPANDSSSSSRRALNSFQIPPFIVTPIELALGAVGRLAASATSIFGFSGDIATNRARPWLEFIDLSAFKPPENGFKGYLERLRVNAPYFVFNYFIVGLVLTIISVITKPIAIIGVGALLLAYFRFFGVETRDDEFQFFGFSLNNSEKLGAMVLAGLLVFWITAGGFQIFLSLMSATALVTVVHGAFRKPSPNAISHQNNPEV